MLPPEGSVYKFYRLAENNVIEVVQQQQEEKKEPDRQDSICLGSLSQGWLVYIQQKDCQVFLYNPISHKDINLPSIETIPSVNGVIRDTKSGFIESFLNFQSRPFIPQQLSKYIIKKMHKSSFCSDPDYLVYDHQRHELFIVTRYIAAGIDPQDGHLVLPEDNLDYQVPYKTLTFDVFRLDFTNDDRVELQYLDGTLGNRAFFVGSNTVFAISITQFPELRPNFYLLYRQSDLAL
ncbi:hypothetical protein FXO37_27396 [Capsicum annuum]|nr:hypothetical protein FXO37_27396 [Capsicum annuum]